MPAKVKQLFGVSVREREVWVIDIHENANLLFRRLERGAHELLCIGGVKSHPFRVVFEIFVPISDPISVIGIDAVFDVFPRARKGLGRGARHFDVLFFAERGNNFTGPFRREIRIAFNNRDNNLETHNHVIVVD